VSLSPKPPQADLKWIFFDLDGTLVDTLPSMYRAHLLFLKSYGIEGDKRKEFDRLNGPNLREVVSYLKKTYALKDSHKKLLRLYRHKILEAYRKRVTLHKGARSALVKSRQAGLRIALVTAADRRLSRQILKRLKIEKYFDFLVCGDEVGRAKPHPAIYKKALLKSKAGRQEVLVVEDSPNGVRAAHRCRLRVTAVSYSTSRLKLQRAGASRVVGHLNALRLLP
jgi:HAD superfamily hydrolase (TIGR01509 family)